MVTGGHKAQTRNKPVGKRWSLQEKWTKVPQYFEDTVVL